MRIYFVAFLAYGALCGEVGYDLNGDSARDLAGIVSAHTIREYEESDIIIGTNGIFIVFADPPSIGELGEIDFSTQGHVIGSSL